MKTLQTPPVALVYLRVSTARQATDGIGLEAQESKCRAHAERMGWQVKAVFADAGISGKDGIEQRAGLRHLITAAHAHKNAVVVVYSVSRLARRQRLLWQLLDDRDGFGLAISSATEAFDTTTPTGRAMLGMIAVFAQLEADMISERTRDALAELKASGVRLGNLGMTELPLETLKYIKQLRVSGNTQRAIMDTLNREQVPTARRTGKWHLRTVQEAMKLAETV